MRTKRSVNEGRVNCPGRGDIDVEVCMSCADIVELRGEGGEDVVVCSPRVVAGTADPLLFRL